jgi:outer membrane lipoprotein SlyB
MNSKLSVFSVVACAGLLWTACTFPSSRRIVPAAQAGTMQNVDTGTVSGVREVNIEGQKSNLGLFGGGVIGAAATRPAPGSGRAAAVGQAAASVTGAVVGQAVEEVSTRKRAQEITVRLDDGRTVVVTQEVTSGLYQDGDRVRIVNGGGGGAHVTMAPN